MRPGWGVFLMLCMSMVLQTEAQVEEAKGEQKKPVKAGSAKGPLPPKDPKRVEVDAKDPASSSSAAWHNGAKGAQSESPDFLASFSAAPSRGPELLNVTAGTADGVGERASTQWLLDRAVEEGTTLAGLRLTHAVVLHFPGDWRVLSVTCRASGGPGVDRASVDQAALAQSLQALLLNVPIHGLRVSSPYLRGKKEEGLPGPGFSFALSFTVGRPPSEECPGELAGTLLVWLLIVIAGGSLLGVILIPCYYVWLKPKCCMYAEAWGEAKHAKAWDEARAWKEAKAWHEARQGEGGRRMSEVPAESPPAAQATPQPQTEGEEMAAEAGGPRSHLSV